MNALFLKDLAEKVRRGQKGRAIAKRSPGGLSYGYNVVKRFGENGNPETGIRSINIQQSSIIQIIFQKYAAGISGRAIAKSLNEAGIPSPRGGLWNATTIIGNRGRRDGILWNEAYLGKILYNRQKFVKDPSTGKRIPRINPQKEWIIVDAPELRIISDEAWSAVHERLDTKKALPLTMRRNPKRLFSGLIHCSECGGPMTIIGEGRIGCSNHRERGCCSNPKKNSIERVENTVLEGVKAQLLQPCLIKEFEDAFYSKIDELASIEADNRDDHTKTLQSLTQQIDRIVDSIAATGPLPSLTARLSELEAKKADQERKGPTQFAGVGIPLPRKSMIHGYRSRIDNLLTHLNADPESKTLASHQLRTLVKKIEVHPLPEKGHAKLKITGDISALAVLDLPGKNRCIDGSGGGI